MERSDNVVGDSQKSEDGTAHESHVVKHHEFGDFGDVFAVKEQYDDGETSENDTSSISATTDAVDVKFFEEISHKDNEKRQSKILCFNVPELLRWALHRFIFKEIAKELKDKRYLMNHYEFIDFTIFEYGNRSLYILWRVFALNVTLLLGAYIFIPVPDLGLKATPYSKFMYMHVWLHILLLFSTAFEVMQLIWYYYTASDEVVARMHYTPWQFKVIWASTNTLSPNFLSCTIMYFLILQETDEVLGQYHIIIPVISSFVNIHQTVSATPCRLAHFYQPVLFNVFYLVVAFFYQMVGFTNPRGQKYVYKGMDWLHLSGFTFLNVFLWVGLTCLIHVTFVICCWLRRLVYRYKRPKTLKCLYGFSNDEYFLYNVD